MMGQRPGTSACLPGHMFLQTGHNHDLAVAHPSGPCVTHDRADHGGNLIILDEEGELDFGEERSVVLTSQVPVQPILLAVITHRLADRSAHDVESFQRSEYRPRPEWFHQSDNLYQWPTPRIGSTGGAQLDKACQTTESVVV